MDQTILSKRNASWITKSIPLNTFILSLVFFDFFLVYIWLTNKEFSTRVIADAAADTAVILIGLSFALSAICYFWQSMEQFIVYRKDLGICGLAYALCHGVIAFWLLPNGFPHTFDYLKQNHIIPFTAAFIALLFFTFMAAISNTFSIRFFGGKTWRRILRIGYLAYIFTIIHIFFNMAKVWVEWYDNGFPSLPPVSIFITIFGLTVLILRIQLQIELWTRKVK